MTSGWYNRASSQMAQALLNLSGGGLKMMLVGTGYTYDPDDDFAGPSGTAAGDPTGEELDCTNYTKGWGGAGRKAVTITVFEKDDDNRTIMVLDNIAWHNLGNGSNDTIAGSILIVEGGADDTDTELIAYFDLTNTVTDGKSVRLQFLIEADGGNMRITTVT